MPLPRIAIVGAPNVGKSTLFNRLVGSRRSLVADVPGLTRDCIEGVFNLTQRPVLLVDTGGLMSPGDAPLAAAIREKVLDAARRSDLLLFVVDGRRGLTPFDRDLSRLFRESGKTTLLVVNKVDGNDRGAYALEFAPLGYDHDSLLSVSAEHGLGISELCEAIGSRLPPPAQDFEHEPAETRIAIAGRPNVGKSSLLNALLKEDRSLVSEEPGTTRDPVDSLLVRGSKRYRFIDTAGLRRAGHVSKKAEILSVGAARRSIRSADVTLVLLDAVEGVVAQDLHVLGLVAGGEEGWVRPAVVLLNKIDLLESRDRIAEKVEAIRERIKFARFAPIVPVSALRRLHLDRVFAAIDAVSEEAARLLKTSELNDWLRDATRRHAPPRQARRPVSLVFASQAGVRPVTIIILTNRDVRLHFSYRRHLENSLRDRFALHHTPIVLRFRARIRDRRPRRGGGSSSGREPPKAPPRAPRGAPRGAPRRAPARGSRGGGSRDRTDPTSEDSAN